GLFEPASGTEVVYSRDFARAAVITPGEGAQVFDATTGAALGRIPEALMPPRRRPHPPLNPRLPSDVFAVRPLHSGGENFRPAAGGAAPPAARVPRRGRRMRLRP